MFHHKTQLYRHQIIIVSSFKQHLSSHPHCFCASGVTAASLLINLIDLCRVSVLHR